MVSAKVRLSEAEKDALVARLNEAPVYLGADKPSKMVFSNGDGTWDVGCTLEGEPGRLTDAVACLRLGIDFP